MEKDFAINGIQDGEPANKTTHKFDSGTIYTPTRSLITERNNVLSRLGLKIIIISVFILFSVNRPTFQG